jgi:hypothetical protein
MIKKSYFTPSTNLLYDLDRKSFIDNIIITNQIVQTIKVFSYDPDSDENNAVSIVGPYGSGKSTTALFLYYYLTNSLSVNVKKELNRKGISQLSNPFNKNDIKVIVGQKTSLDKSLKQAFKFRNNFTNSINDKFIKKGKRLVLIIDEFGKYLEYASQDPENGDVYVLQELAELASRSNGLFKLITIRHQAITGYFSVFRDSYLNEWRKIQGRFFDIVHSNTIEDTLTLINPLLEQFAEKKYKPQNEINDLITYNPAIGDLSAHSITKNSYPFHPFTILLLVSAYKRFAQNERSVFTFLHTSERYGIKQFLLENKGVYQLHDFYDYLKHNLEHNILESPFSQDWNKIETALRDLKVVKEKSLVENIENVKRLVKIIGMLDLFGHSVGLKADDKTLSVSLLTESNSLKKPLIKKILNGLNKENLVTYNNYHGGSYHLWHGSHLNINDLINKTVLEQKGQIDFAKQLERLVSNEPIIAKKHLIEKGTFRCVELRYLSINDIKNRKPTPHDGIFYIFLVQNKSQLKMIDEKLKEEKFDPNEKPLILQLNSNIEKQIREFLAVSYIEQNNEHLKGDPIGREELGNIKYFLSNQVDAILRNHKIFNINIWLHENGLLQKRDYKDISTRCINNWFSSLYQYTPVIKNELINRKKPSPSANVGAKKLLNSMLESSHLEAFEIKTSGPEKSIYLNVLKQTGLHQQFESGFSFTRPIDPGLSHLWDHWDTLIKETKDDNNRISVMDLIIFSQKPPYGLKFGMAHFLSIIKLFSMIDKISVYHKRVMTQEFMYLPRIEKDTIELLAKRPENFEIKYVDLKIHQSLFPKLLQCITHDKKQNNRATLLDVAKSIIEKVHGLRQRTVKTVIGITPQAQLFIKEVRDARSPENLIFEKIPVSLGLPPITSVSNTMGKNYIVRLKAVIDNIEEFEENLYRNLKELINGVWDLGLKSDTSTSNIKKKMNSLISESVLEWVFDERLKEFINRVIDKERINDDWLESVSSHLVGKLPDKWSDDDIPVFVESLKLMKMQYEEAEMHWLKHRADQTNKDIDTSKIEDKIIALLNKINISEDEKQLAIIRLYHNYVKTKEKN